MKNKNETNRPNENKTLRSGTRAIQPKKIKNRFGKNTGTAPLEFGWNKAKKS